ncbi:MAG: DUF3795 domain-containing protein [Theionarchaea archaeon]|nr:DUF3795 domain-containing protein [Theionarchaea archaeon]
MTQYLGVCGIFCCTDCEVYEAAHSDDVEVKMKVIKNLEHELGITVDPSQLWCEGCQGPEEKMWFECRLCLIRRCGKKQGVRICLECEFYPCQVLKVWLSISESAPKNLQEMSGMGVNTWIEKKLDESDTSSLST